MEFNLPSLTTIQKNHLDTHGFVSLGVLLSKQELDDINQRLQDIQYSEGDDAGKELKESKYIRHPVEVFDIFYTHPKVLAGISFVLGDQFKLSSLNYRAAKPGMGKQKLHVDWKNGVAEGTYRVCNSIWLLDDFTTENGATRLVPGTHKSKHLPQDVIEDLEASHPHEHIITAPAGTVFIFNSHVWHGGTQNKTDKPRRSIHSYFCTRDEPQQINQKKYITPETRNRIGELGIKILDV